MTTVNNPEFVVIPIEGSDEVHSFVPLDYRMNPETEDLLYADELQEGMMVLVSDSAEREDPFRAINAPDMVVHTLPALRKRNRWCRVTKFRKLETVEGSGYYSIRFIGVYEDGERIVRSSSPAKGWLVKLDSIKESASKIDGLASFVDAQYASFKAAGGVVVHDAWGRYRRHCAVESIAHPLTFAEFREGLAEYFEVIVDHYTFPSGMRVRGDYEGVKKGGEGGSREEERNDASPGIKKSTRPIL